MYRNKIAKRLFSDNPYAYTVLQNLKDAGCDEETVKKFMSFQDNDDREQQMQLLNVHRRHLLDMLHKDEKRIDCLDYLIYRLQKNG